MTANNGRWQERSAPWLIEADFCTRYPVIHSEAGQSTGMLIEANFSGWSLCSGVEKTKQEVEMVRTKYVANCGHFVSHSSSIPFNFDVLFCCRRCFSVPPPPSPLPCHFFLSFTVSSSSVFLWGTSSGAERERELGPCCLL